MIKKIGVLLLISTTVISQDKGQFENYSNPFYKTIVTESNDYDKKEKEEMSAFERSRLANIATNQAIVKDLSSAAAKIAPKPVGRPKTPASRKKAAPVKREEPRPTRTSSRLAGIEADSETQKRKAEVEYEFAVEHGVGKLQDKLSTEGIDPGNWGR